MKPILLFLFPVLIYHCCTGYPIIDDGTRIKNETSFEYKLWAFNETPFYDSVPMDGFFKKVIDKVKDKVKDFNKIKDKIKNCKNLLNIITFSVAEKDLENIPIKNGTKVEYWFERYNDTAFNSSLTLEMHGFFKKVKDKIKNCKDILKFLSFQDVKEISEDRSASNSNETAIVNSTPLHGFGKKVVNKVKEGIKTAKDGLNKVKDKIKDKFNKVKDKFKDTKDKTKSKGGSGGGSGSYRDKYDRDIYDRDRYDRDRYDKDRYRKDSKYTGGGGSSDPIGVWFLVVFGILMFVVVVASVVCYKTKN